MEECFEEYEPMVDDESNIDPVIRLWSFLKEGYPLMTLYNATRPRNPISVDENLIKTDIKRAKAATFKFVDACLKELHFASADCFLMMDLFENDTTGFVKVSSTQIFHK